MDNQNNGRVIITSSRNIMALVVARSLGQRDIEIIGADCIGMTFLKNSRKEKCRRGSTRIKLPVINKTIR